MSAKFKVGDRVVRITRDWRDIQVGDVRVVAGVYDRTISLKGGEDLKYDVDFFKLEEPLIVVKLSVDRPFAVGDHIRMISEDPSYGLGKVKVGDIGVIVRFEHGDPVVDFPSQRDWNAHKDDIEHVDFVVQNLPEISLDEAVVNCQNLRQQIAELEVKAKQYEQVMRKHGLKFI